ncbi:MAG: hypothetical protein U9N87_03100 [Planctomycetota bacterium]|nr:hypothetical protein [Planctomycetota bacterium]
MFKRILIAVALATTFFLVGESPAAAPLLKVGLAEADITPEIGMERPGGYGKSYLRSVHDPCKVRVAVFDDGKKRVALVGVDTLAVPRQFVKDVREDIQKKCGIPPEAVLIGASHSHSSGPLSMIVPGDFDHASPEVRDLAYKRSSNADLKYMKTTRDAIVKAVCKANAARVESACGVGSGLEDKAAFNRRFRMKNGLTYTHPGQGNPDIVEPAGPIDPEVGVIGIWDKSGNKLRGCVVNYACHATTGPSGGFSANWIYYLEKVIRGALGPDAIVVFLQGACGDITQVDNRNPYKQPSQDRWAQIVGGRVGAEAVKVLISMHRGPLAPVDARQSVWNINRRIPRPERVKESKAIVKKKPAEVGAANWTFAKEIVLLDALIAKSLTEEVEVQAVQVGPAVFVTNPAEFFVDLGLRIKKKSPMRFTFPVELANGCTGYVPTAEALGPKGGGYETRLTCYSNLEPSAGKQMVEAGLKLVGQMKPGKMPTPPPARPFSGNGWSYGNVPPEVD